MNQNLEKFAFSELISNWQMDTGFACSKKEDRVFLPKATTILWQKLTTELDKPLITLNYESFERIYEARMAPTGEEAPELIALFTGKNKINKAKLEETILKTQKAFGVKNLIKITKNEPDEGLKQKTEEEKAKAEEERRKAEEDKRKAEEDKRKAEKEKAKAEEERQKIKNQSKKKQQQENLIAKTSTLSYSPNKFQREQNQVEENRVKDFLKKELPKKGKYGYTGLLSKIKKPVFFDEAEFEILLETIVDSVSPLKKAHPELGTSGVLRHSSRLINLAINTENIANAAYKFPITDLDEKIIKALEQSKELKELFEYKKRAFQPESILRLIEIGKSDMYSLSATQFLSTVPNSQLELAEAIIKNLPKVLDEHEEPQQERESFKIKGKGHKITQDFPEARSIARRLRHTFYALWGVDKESETSNTRKNENSNPLSQKTRSIESVDCLKECIKAITNDYLRTKMLGHIRDLTSDRFDTLATRFEKYIKPSPYYDLETVDAMSTRAKEIMPFLIHLKIHLQQPKG